ncbi:GGDEF domain-containing protein [Aquincola sp. S2]|uniref:diguanylate cyclase n=1 Tax=Pseudaquabacterium terrae TaxID=2732868 RepID=A0ABX2EIH6_9BURK|nr:GGDEF domain-containing protein [Aquabacterium terrae]NRF68379.1 GGDEF domain-containing protein [Aquabacterium terrae]
MSAPRTAAVPTSAASSVASPSGLDWQRWVRRIGPLKLALVVLPVSLLLAALTGAALAAITGASIATLALLGSASALPAVLVAAALFWRAGPGAVPALPEIDVAATRDALTGAFTQRHFVAATDREWARIRRHGEDAALLMVDVDHFRALNDKQGPACGDAALVEITRLASATLRQYDLLARFGGGVLVVYLPHTDPIGALDVAERIRERVAGYRLTWESQSIGVTVSIGVAAVGADHAALDAVIADAGTALREAKAAGRNCVRAAPVQPRRQPAPGASIGDRRAKGPI